MYKGNRGFAPRGGGFAPVKVGEELDVKIESVGEKGDGIARKQGFVLFVPNTKQGDQVKIRVTKVLRKVGFAEVIDSKESSASQESEGDTDSSNEDTTDTEDFGEESEEETQEE